MPSSSGSTSLLSSPALAPASSSAPPQTSSSAAAAAAATAAAVAAATSGYDSSRRLSFVSYADIVNEERMSELTGEPLWDESAVAAGGGTDGAQAVAPGPGAGGLMVDLESVLKSLEGISAQQQGGASNNNNAAAAQTGNVAQD